MSKKPSQKSMESKAIDELKGLSQCHNYEDDDLKLKAVKDPSS